MVCASESKDFLQICIFTTLVYKFSLHLFHL
jgi:hypothetical protein